MIRLCETGGSLNCFLGLCRFTVVALAVQCSKFSVRISVPSNMTLTAARVDKGRRLCSVTKRGKMATRVKWFDLLLLLPLLLLLLRVTMQLNSLFPPEMTMMLYKW